MMSLFPEDRGLRRTNSRLPVLIDTDPGLDDALALFLACASPGLEISGVTTVAGNIGLERVTENALKLLDFLGRADIPVIAGAERPLAREPLPAADIHGEDGLGGIALPASSRAALAQDATAFMEAELMRRPAQSLRVLALGPLTNVAKLIESRPSAAMRIERIVAMGGAVRDNGNVTPFAEFNIAADPEAADRVLHAKIPLTLVPLDVTRKVAADPGFCSRLAEAGGRAGSTSAALIDAYLANIAARRKAKGLAATPGQAPQFPLHDPCVILHAIDPDLFRSERLPIRIVTDRSERDGETRIDQNEGVETEVLTQAKEDEALALAFELLRSLP
jgi:purine nucleosidase/pyrimidine-specific ribonucleoside hydrolase